MPVPVRKLAVTPLLVLFGCLQPEAQPRAQIPGNPEPVAGKVRENSRDGLKYIWIPPEIFQMGCSPGDSECYYDEKPSHLVGIRKGFWIGQTDVTRGAYTRFAASSGRQPPAAPGTSRRARDNMAMVNVSWDDAQAYCGWAGGRLPTEAEWEYAARGGSTEARYGPIDEIAWYVNNSGAGIHEVAQKRPNGFGLYDMLGNVWQWVGDWYAADYYKGGAATDPAGPSSGVDRVLRGGDWVSSPRDVRASVRSRVRRSSGGPSVGFRCVQEMPSPQR